MGDRILNIGQKGLETSDERFKAMVNNLVNAQTPAFRKSEVQLNSFPMELDKAKNKIDGAMIPEVRGVYQSQVHGPLLKTGGSTDIALGSDGYFVLQGPSGEMFTRDGRFRTDDNGMVISVAGNYPLLGQGGPVQVDRGAKIDIMQNGDIKSDGTIVDTIRSVILDDTSKLESVNGSLFRIPANSNYIYTEDENPRMLQGYIEGSNVNVMDEMMEMVYLGRIFGVDTKLIQARDASLSRALEMGRPAQ